MPLPQVLLSEAGHASRALVLLAASGVGGRGSQGQPLSAGQRLEVVDKAVVAAVQEKQRTTPVPLGRAAGGRSSTPAQTKTSTRPALRPKLTSAAIPTHTHTHTHSLPNTHALNSRGLKSPTQALAFQTDAPKTAGPQVSSANNYFPTFFGIPQKLPSKTPAPKLAGLKVDPKLFAFIQLGVEEGARAAQWFCCFFFAVSLNTRGHRAFFCRFCGGAPQLQKRCPSASKMMQRDTGMNRSVIVPSRPEGEPGKIARAGADTTQRHLGHALGGKAGNEAVAQGGPRGRCRCCAPCRRRCPRGRRGSGSAPRLPSWGCEGTAGCPAASETPGGCPPAWPRRSCPGLASKWILEPASLSQKVSEGARHGDVVLRHAVRDAGLLRVRRGVAEHPGTFLRGAPG